MSYDDVPPSAALTNNGSTLSVIEGDSSAAMDVQVNKDSSCNVPSLSSLCFPTLQSLAMQPIDLSVPMPVTCIGGPGSSEASRMSDSMPQDSALKDPLSLCFRTKRFKHRKEVAYRMALRGHWLAQQKLLNAVSEKDYTKVSELLEFGLDPNACDSKKRSPLHLAASQGQSKLVRLLLSQKANPNQQDILGNTPLHLAVCRGDLESVRILIENGSNIFKRDNSERTPLSLVRNRLYGVRRNKTSTANAFKTEFILMSELLSSSAARQTDGDSFVSSIDGLCQQMQQVSTRERAEEIAEAAIQEMSNAVSSVSLSNIPLL